MKKRAITLLLTLFLLGAQGISAHDGIIHTGCTEPGKGIMTTDLTDGTIHTGLTADGIIQNGFSDGIIHGGLTGGGSILTWFIDGIMQPW